MYKFDVERAKKGHAVTNAKNKDLTLIFDSSSCWNFPYLKFSDNEWYSTSGRSKADQLFMKYTLKDETMKNDEEIKKIPFDLKRALSGDKCITRDGANTVVFYSYDNHDKGGEFILEFRMPDGRKHRDFLNDDMLYNLDGRFSLLKEDSDFDLFMAPIEKKKVKKTFYSMGKVDSDGDLLTSSQCWASDVNKFNKNYAFEIHLNKGFKVISCEVEVEE